MKIFTHTLYNFVIKQYHHYFQDFAKDNQISQVEIDILAFLYNNPLYQHAQDIIDVKGISKAHASLAIEKLVKKGYLTRQPDPQCRRCNILIITDEAKDIVSQIITIQKTYNHQAYQGISDEDLDTYSRVLAKITENLGGKVYECQARER